MSSQVDFNVLDVVELHSLRNQQFNNAYGQICGSYHHDRYPILLPTYPKIIRVKNFNLRLLRVMKFILNFETIF